MVVAPRLPLKTGLWNSPLEVDWLIGRLVWACVLYWFALMLWYVLCGFVYIMIEPLATMTEQAQYRALSYFFFRQVGHMN